MPPQTRALVWKEWRERRASLCLATAWIICGLVYTIVYEVATGIRGSVSRYYSICMIFGLFTPVFLAMRTALGERTAGTTGFSASLPASLRQMAAIRLLGALVTLAGPILLGAIVLSVVVLTGALEQSGFRMPSGANYLDFQKRFALSRWQAFGMTWRCATISVASASELLLILCVIGARRRSEAQVGFLGAVLGFAWILPTSLLNTFSESSYKTAVNWLGGLLPQSLVLPHSYSMMEGSYDDIEFAGFIWDPLCLNLLALAGLSVWFTHRFAGAVPWTAERKTRFPWRLPPLLSRLPLRLPGRAAALVWLDLRQSVPLAVAGLALAFVFSFAQVCLKQHDPALSSPYGDPNAMTVAAGELPGTTWVLATLWSAVVAAGIFGAELQPGLANFWRSRPISPSGWFWTKFTIGLVATLTVLDGVTIAVSWNSPYAGGASRMSWTYVACMPLLHALFYALTVFAVCSLRRPVLAVMCATLGIFFLSMILETLSTRERGFDPIFVYNNLFLAEKYVPEHPLDFTAHNYPAVYGSIAVLIVLAALGASRFVRRFPAVRS
jgi:ABC-type transport system involved in multi-copper enzyme maturation permease subunit